MRVLTLAPGRDIWSDAVEFPIRTKLSVPPDLEDAAHQRLRALTMPGQFALPKLLANVAIFHCSLIRNVDFF